MIKMKRFGKFILYHAAAGLVLSKTGCHGKQAGRDFKMPETFDESREYEIVFWAKNDTNQTQTQIYEKCVSDFEAPYPNIHVSMKLYNDY